MKLRKRYLLRKRHLLKGVKFPRGWGVYFDLARRGRIDEAMGKIFWDISLSHIECSLYTLLLTIADLLYRHPSEHGLIVCSFLTCPACPVEPYRTVSGGLCASQSPSLEFRERVAWDLLRLYGRKRDEALELGFSPRGTFRI